MSRRYRITPRAAEDLRSIARHTLKAWGRTQRDDGIDIIGVPHQRMDVIDYFQAKPIL